jgi:UDPglucose--hexose-1-phosphate uridylyltransferase
VPGLVREEFEASRRYYDMKERCIFCDIIAQEREDGKRVIYENDSYIAIAPFAPRTPFETWILPKEHQSSFQPVKNDFMPLADILQRTLKQLDAVLDIPPYNFIIHTSPFNEEENEFYRWHIEITPKLTKIAGFEWGSGFFINSVPPEDSARFMREARI